MGEAGEPIADPQCIALLKESIQHLEEPMQEESNYIFTVLGASVSLFQSNFIQKFNALDVFKTYRS